MGRVANDIAEYGRTLSRLHRVNDEEHPPVGRFWPRDALKFSRAMGQLSAGADKQVPGLPAETLTFLATDADAGLIESVVSARSGTPLTATDANGGAMAVFASAANAVVAAMEVHQRVSA